MTRFDRRAAVLFAVVAVGLTSAGAQIAGANPPSAGFLLLLVVLFSATTGGLAAVRTYTNPQGTAFQPIQDTTAFPCP